MMQSDVKKEKNDIIYKYQKTDVVGKLCSILGNDFKKYREEFDKTQNFLETGHIAKFPLTISLELVNRCNLNCIMCYKTHHSDARAELSLDIIKKVLDECKKYKMPAIILGLASETMIYKDIKKVLEMIREAGIQDIFFGTNGVLLDDKTIEAVINNGVTRIEISLDAATPATYKKIRGFDHLEKIERNIKKLIEARKKYGSELPLIRLCFVVMEENKHEIELFRNKWQDVVDYVDFQRCVDFSKVDTEEDVNQSLIDKSFCSYPFYSLNIYANGNVSPCCCFYGKKLVFGNIHQRSLKEVWDGALLKELREQISTKKFNPICARCQYYRDRDVIDNVFK